MATSIQHAFHYGNIATSAIIMANDDRKQHINSSHNFYALHPTSNTLSTIPTWVATSAIMVNDDLKQRINSSHDFYALLDLPITASAAQIGSAKRKTALQYHPDKVGAETATTASETYSCRGLRLPLLGCCSTVEGMQSLERSSLGGAICEGCENV
jgi:hypothetical protein